MSVTAARPIRTNSREDNSTRALRKPAPSLLWVSFPSLQTAKSNPSAAIAVGSLADSSLFPKS